MVELLKRTGEKTEVLAENYLFKEGSLASNLFVGKYVRQDLQYCLYEHLPQYHLNLLYILSENFSLGKNSYLRWFWGKRQLFTL